MITSKERAELKRIISTEPCAYQVGKDSLNQANIDGIKDCLFARELIKINILQNCDDSAKDIANKIAGQLNCEVVGVIGRKVILYKFNPKKQNHVLKIKM